MFLVELNWLQDAELLGRLGRDALAVVLERLAPLLAQQGKALPDASLPDVLYFPKLAAVLRAPSVKVAIYLAKDSRQHRDATKAAGDAVRSAIRKLLRNLVGGSASAASPGSVQREFARHLQRHLLIPSGRYAGPKARQARGELTGSLLYEPPPGLLWVINRPKGTPSHRRENFSPHTG
jgi:hypothetical protein